MIGPSPARDRHDEGWVLITDGGIGQGRSTLAAARALAAGGYRVAVAASRSPCPAARSKATSLLVSVPRVTESAFPSTIRATALRLGAVEVFPATDAAMVAIGAPGVAFLDKAALAGRATDAGLTSAPGERFPSVDTLERARARLPYPVVVKPADRSRFPATVLASADSEHRIPEDGPLLVQPFLTGEQRAIAGVIYDGQLVAAVHQRAIRLWPDPCGGASAAETTEPDLQREAALARLLDGYDGIFMAQFVGEQLIDLNARVYGSLPLAIAAGVNLPAIAADLRRGAKGPLVRARPGVRYRRLDADVRALLTRSARAKTLPPLRELLPRRGTAHGVGSLRDPAPLLAHVERIIRSRARRLIPG